MEPKELQEQLKAALIKDFDALYVKEFTTGWKVERIIRSAEIAVMQLPNTMKIFDTRLTRLTSKE